MDTGGPGISELYVCRDGDELRSCARVFDRPDPALLVVLDRRDHAVGIISRETATALRFRQPRATAREVMTPIAALPTCRAIDEPSKADALLDAGAPAVLVLAGRTLIACIARR
jgi:hypothetical protein